MAVYAQKFQEHTPLRIRFSLRNLKKDKDLLNLPLFMIDHLAKFIDIAR